MAEFTTCAECNRIIRIEDADDDGCCVHCGDPETPRSNADDVPDMPGFTLTENEDESEEETSE